MIISNRLLIVIDYNCCTNVLGVRKLFLLLVCEMSKQIKHLKIPVCKETNPASMADEAVKE